MKKTVVIILALALAAGTAFAALGQIVASWRSPANYPLAAARPNNAGFFWIYCNSSPYRIWHVRAETGSLVGSYVSPHGSATRGLAYSYGGSPGGSYLWIGNYSTDRVYMTNYATGSAYRSWAAGHDPYGLAPEATANGGYNPQSIISTDTSPTYTWFHVPTTGSIIRSVSHGGNYAYDVAWDWQNKLIWGGMGGGPGIVRGWTTTGSVFASFTVPNYPYALTYFAPYLWVGVTTPLHYFYKIHCPILPGSTVVPTSVGKVKALFK